MKIKEQSQQVKEKVVEKFQAGLGLRKISQALNISKNAVHSIIQKSKEFSSTANLPKHGRPATQAVPSHTALFGDGLKRPVVILEKLPRSTDQQGRRMDGVGWSSSRSHETFRADTLSRLASFIARTDTKQQSHQHSHRSHYGCQECEKDVPYQKDLLQHQELKNTLPKPHRCPLCGQQFSLRSSLQLHQCQCDGSRGPARHAASCTTLLSNPGRLQDKSLYRQPHLLDSSPYACAPCGRSFSQKQALLHHQQAGCSGSPSSPNVTDVCSLPYDSPPVSEGNSAHSDVSDVPGPSSDSVSMCQICSRIFCTEAALLRHIQDCHMEEKLNAKTQRDAEEAGTVEASGASKERTKSKKKLLSCRSCDMVFRCTSQLYLHRKEKHRREKLIMREPRPVTKKLRKVVPYPCQICGKVFLHHLSFRAHYRRHVEEGCAPVSNGIVKDSQPLKLNASVAKNRLPLKKGRRAGPGRPRSAPRVLFNVSGREQPEHSEFPCPSCPEVFPVQQQLKEHMELHQSSSRRHQCSVCTSQMDASKGPGSKRQRLYHCVPCQQGFSALEPFLEHCQEHLRIRVEEERMSEGHALQGSKG
ncbi:PREDICTED: zinc finger protein 629-like [Cyprinodon variegatus]|nr:PREDICTED: zinc finger protein 629-like [Cyprinodon variegatus]